MVLPALIGAGAALYASNKASKSAEKAGDKNAALQKEMAQQGIQWRVKDAELAGVSPLVALGATLPQASPSYVGADPASMASTFSDVGQNLGRAINATQNKTTRTLSSLQIQAATADVEGKELDNQIKASQLATMNSQVGPAFPSANDNPVIAGQGDGYIVNPNELTASTSEKPQQEAGFINDYGYIRTGADSYAPVQSKDAKGRLEEDLVGSVGWNVRNRILPMFSKRKPPFPAPEGKHWSYNPFTDEYKLKEHRLKTRSKNANYYLKGGK